jgi:hypothetical protein
MPAPPLLIKFVADSWLRREAPFTPKLPIVGNGPPGTFVVFANGHEVPLPTDQIVEDDDASGAAHVGFGGLRFDRIEEGQFVFLRVKDLWPQGRLSPERSWKMTLKLELVAAILVEGILVWPPKERMN